MSDSLENIWNSQSPRQLEQIAGVVHEWKSWSDIPLAEVFDLLQRPAESSEDASSDAPVLRRAEELILGRWVQLQSEQARTWSAEELQRLAKFYRATDPTSPARNLVLTLFAVIGTEEARMHWVDLVCDSPPEYRPTLPMSFLAVVRNPEWLGDEVFAPLLTRAIQHVPVAAAVLDMANYAVRRGIREDHPCRHRAAELTELLGRLVEQLERVEEGELAGQVSPQQLSQTVNDATALIVALVDALALMNYEPAVGKLHRALKLRHRRLKVEAAAALARMGDDTGRDVLIAMAEFPSVRQRALAYARELGIEKDISLEWQGEIATMESHLAMWLAEPEQMGMAPTSLELVDQRRLHWPGEDEPVNCYLFLFKYGRDEFANIGMSGPLVHAFPADLRVLSRRDQYAAFAGWQTEHAEIFTLPHDRARDKLPDVVRQLEQTLRASDHEEARPVALGGFFSDYQLVAESELDGEPGMCIVSADSVEWIGAGNPSAPIDWALALDIWRGRKLLEQFNPDETFESST